VDRLKREYGLKSVDVVMPTHMHDDHMNGFPHLLRHFGTKVWCYENMKDVFENPRGYNLGCILGEKFRVDRTFGHGEKFKWEEYDFEITHSPGHTEYQMALFGTIDGKRMAFTGDAFFTPEARYGGALRHNIIFRNHVETDSHLKSVRNLIEHEPELICPGHGRAFPVNRDVMLKTEQRFRRQRELFAELLPEGEDGFGLDPSWVALYPYQPVFTPGKTERLEVRARNYYAAPMKLEVALVAPAEWHIVPDLLRLEVPAGASVTGRIDVMVPKGWAAPGPRFAVTLDVARNGKYLGQVTEAVVELAASTA
jgi:glyoxylase-like metal-dependent hydrolase (beta-lactamase superfamily II)